mmetsp:Transcript_42013/g.44043  ORF Transcript_42013/g.44043 Transcript_42013/m.44043 type:complete len:316 (-) Transcript_42013:137-1084(-)
MSVRLLLLVFLCCFSASLNYELTDTPCRPSFKQQSPINLVSNNAIYREERFFRIISSNYTAFNTPWEDFPEDKSMGWSGDLGTIILVRDWSMYRFNLTKVLFRYGSAHSVDEFDYNIEVELHHKLDTNYRTKGRYIHPSSEKLIISTFFMGQEEIKYDEDGDPIPRSLLFNYTNLEQLKESPNSQTVSFEREIKLSLLVQNTPGFLYEGTVDAGFCESSWRLVLPKYQTIPQIHVNYFRDIFTSKGYLEAVSGSTSSRTSNSRDRQPINTGTIIYRNDANKTRLLAEENVNQYDTSKFINVEGIVLFLALVLLLV